MIELQAVGTTAMPLKCNQWLEGLHGLEGSLEADGSRFDGMLGICLGHDRTNQVVGEDVRPYFFVHKLRCLASQYVHLHGRLDGTQIKLLIPARPKKKSQILLGRFPGIKQSCHDDDCLRPESCLLNSKTRFANGNGIGK